MVSVGAVLFFNGLYIYAFHRANGDVNVLCLDLRININMVAMDIHQEHRYIMLEFAGAIASVLFYVS